MAMILLRNFAKITLQKCKKGKDNRVHGCFAFVVLLPHY